MTTRISAESQANPQSHDDTSTDPLTNEPEQITEPEPDGEPFDPPRAPSVIEDGKLIAAPALTAEERREAERAAWLADEAIHPTGSRCDDGGDDEPIVGLS